MIKGVYITEEAKQEIEAKISELEIRVKKLKEAGHTHRKTGVMAQIALWEEILRTATILPVEENWIDIGEKYGTFLKDDAEILSDYLSNGVIIKQKS